MKIKNTKNSVENNYEHAATKEQTTKKYNLRKQLKTEDQNHAVTTSDENEHQVSKHEKLVKYPIFGTKLCKRARNNNKKDHSPLLFTNNLSSSQENCERKNNVRKRTKNCKKTMMKFNNGIDNEENILKPKRRKCTKSKSSSTNKEQENDTKWIIQLTAGITDYDSIKPNADFEDYSKRLAPSPPVGEPNVESPESKKRRIEIISKQCRLHPSNVKYNQGPVSNPPLISPGKIVGYTPAGQRYEVDLNAHRPKWFNSEYARMQFDDATIINATRMIHELKTGHFLPDTLDPEVERQYYYQKACAKIGAHTFVQETLATDLSNDTLENKIRIIEAEKRLIEIVKFAAIKINDFPTELNVMIQEAMQTDINVLVLKKYPIIVYAIDKLAKQCQHLDVAKSAQAFFNKIKKLFNASDSGSLFEHLKCEAQKLNEECKDKKLFDLIYMTEKAKDEIESEASKTEANPPNSLNCQDPKAKSGNHNNAQDPTDGQEFVTDTAPILTNRRVAQAADVADHHSVNQEVDNDEEDLNEWIPLPEDGNDYEDINNNNLGGENIDVELEEEILEMNGYTVEFEGLDSIPESDREYFRNVIDVVDEMYDELINNDPEDELRPEE